MAENEEKKAKAPKKAPKKGGEASEAAPTSKAVSNTQAVAPRFFEKYNKDIIPALTKQFGYKNPNQVPKLQKIVVNMGLGQAVTNPKIIDSAVDELRAFTGQKPVVTRAKKSIANFKLREGMPIGCRVTLRGAHMYEFFDRLVNVALPRIRDFRGVPTKSFDGRGNYTLGLKEQINFPEIDYDKIMQLMGMDITFVTTAKTDEESRELLALMNMPFRK